MMGLERSSCVGTKPASVSDGKSPSPIVGHDSIVSALLSCTPSRAGVLVIPEHSSRVSPLPPAVPRSEVLERFGLLFRVLPPLSGLIVWGLVLRTF